MEEILKKGDRLEKPRNVTVPLRGEVYKWLSDIAVLEHCSVSRIIRAFVEDAYDNSELSAPDQEVSGND